jgi:diguanylate cyclase (GGDEF)-like protein
MSDDKTIIAEPGSFSVLTNPARRNQACLVQYSGAGLGKRYLLQEKEVSIGRATTATIFLNENSVSRDHARIYCSDSGEEVEDKGSSNGTYVNDERISTRVPLKDGDIIRLGTILLKYFDSDNIDGIVQDKIYRMATTDVLTQIFNRQYLMDALASEFKVSKAYKTPLTLIYYDLDHFKRVNDNYGHNAGDTILKESCNLVRKVVRKDDIFGRVGGEEFVIVLPKTDADTAVDLAERVRRAHESHVFDLEFEKNGQTNKVAHRQTVSLGVAQLAATMSEPEHLLSAADRKLYTSKETGRNKVSV